MLLYLLLWFKKEIDSWISEFVVCKIQTRSRLCERSNHQIFNNDDKVKECMILQQADQQKINSILITIFVVSSPEKSSNKTVTTSTSA